MVAVRHDTPSLRQVANVMLPMAAYAEQSGTTLIISISNPYRAAVMPRGEANPVGKFIVYWRIIGHYQVGIIRTSTKFVRR